MLSYLEKHEKSTKSKDEIHFYISSGGNAGLACITAALALHCKASVVVPTSTEEFMINKLWEAGGTEVIVHGDSWFDADKYLRETVMAKATERGHAAIYVPPFDHSLVWEGAATMIDEIREQMSEKPDAIICSVGGGGLFAGVMLGIDRAGWDKEKAVQVLAVETRGADSLAQSVAKGELVTLPGITSVAKSLGAVRVAKHPFEQALRDHVATVVVEDAEACSACLNLANDQRYLVEPACGASLAPVYNGRLKDDLKDFSPDTKVVVIVCGGSAITLDKLEGYKKQFAL
jgi:L-serine/L-threonine ammonia-lyase